MECQGITFWSFAASGAANNSYCSCDNKDPNPATLPAEFVGENYFCDAIGNGVLWDGTDCISDCCTFNNPPLFHVTLPNPTSDSIEVRLCSDEEINEGVYVRLIEIYVQ